MQYTYTPEFKPSVKLLKFERWLPLWRKCLSFFSFHLNFKNRAFSWCEVFFFKHLTESDIQTLCPNFYDWKRFNSWLFFLSVCYRSVSWQTTPMPLKLSSAKRQTLYRILCENNRSKSSCFNQFLRLHSRSASKREVIYWDAFMD